MNPGLHPNIPPAVYHEFKACSASLMSKLAISPAHCLDAMQNPDSDPTPAKTLGSAVHTAVFEPVLFQSRYAVRLEGVSGVTKEGKAFKEQAESAGKTVLSCEDGRWCDAIASRVRKHTLIADALRDESALVESSCVWERDGYLSKCRPDLMVRSTRTLYDLKTTITGHPLRFPREMVKYGYHRAGSWYLDGVSAVTGESWDRFVFIAAEKRRPFVVTFYELRRGSDAFMRAQAECNQLFKLYTDCCRARRWPGYSDDLIEVVLPETQVLDLETVEEPLE